MIEAVQADLASGARVTKPIVQTEVTLAEIHPGGFFIVGGQLAYIADATEEFVTQYERKDRRLRVIYDNATESNVLARSFQKALYRDETSRRITELSAGPLFGNAAEDDDLGSGTIYVLRSRSSHPYVAEHRELIHKIGVTGQAVEARIANAVNDPTFLLAEVEVVATYKLFNINRTRLEGLIHRALAPHTSTSRPMIGSARRSSPGSGFSCPSAPLMSWSPRSATAVLRISTTIRNKRGLFPTTPELVS